MTFYAKTKGSRLGQEFILTLKVPFTKHHHSRSPSQGRSPSSQALNHRNAECYNHRWSPPCPCCVLPSVLSSPFVLLLAFS